MRITRKRLQAIRALRQEIDTLEKKYIKMPRIEEVADTVGDYSFGTKRTLVIRGQSDERSRNLEEKLLIKQAKLENEALLLENFLENVEDSEMRDILRLYFVLGLTQEEIGRRKGYSRQAITKKIDKFFEENKSSTSSESEMV